MKLIRDIETQINESVITIGNFDGVHVGHQRLIDTLIAASHEMQLPSVLLTFEPHPTEFFSPHSPASRLMRFREKWLEIKKYRVDYFYCMRFNAHLAQLSARAFVKEILVKQLNAKKIVIGDDFRFGAKRQGDVALLRQLGKQYDFDVIAITQSLFRGDRVSSSRVRNALYEGDFDSVRALTNRSYCLTGKVVHGDQVGRQLGFPTANIYLHRKQVPLSGIFVVRVHGLNQSSLPGVASLGYRPTFDGKAILLEVYLFDFNEMIYGRRITVEFVKKIRDEERFDTIPMLVAQIERDVLVARGFFKI